MLRVGGTLRPCVATHFSHVRVGALDPKTAGKWQKFKLVLGMASVSRYMGWL